MTIGKRFEIIRENLGFEKKNSFADKCAVNPQFITDIEKDKKNPTVKIMLILYENWNVNLHYLITGVGDMFITERTTLQEPESEYHTSSHVGQALEKCEKEKERLWDQVEWLRAELDEYKKKDTG